MEEIFDLIASTYRYTYQEFLEQITPRLAQRFLEIITLRQNNDAVYNAMLIGLASRGQDIGKFIRRKEKAVEKEAEQVSDKQLDAMQKKILKRMQGKK